MGKKGSWFSAVKKVLISEQTDEKDQKTIKSKKKWFGNQKSSGDISLFEETSTVAACALGPPPPVEDVKLTEAQNGQNKHVYSVALATAEAAVAAAQAAAEVVRLATVSRYPGKSDEEIAAIKIQTAFRGYLARRALRALRGLVRLKSLIQGQSVKRQATSTLRCMQTLARVQSQIRARRIRVSEENLALQRQLQQKREKEVEKLRVLQTGEQWDLSTKSKEQIKAKMQHKQEAAIRRERALAYAFSHQQTWKNSSKSANPTFMDPNNPHWGWSWLERWMAARPWDSESTNYNDLASIKSTTSRAMSTGEISSTYSHRNLNHDNKDSPTANKLSRPPSHRQFSSTPSKALSASSATGKIRPPSPKGSQWGGDELRRNLNHDTKDSPTERKLNRPPSHHLSPSTPPSEALSTSFATGKIRSPSPKGSQWGGDDDSRSTFSVQSERYRRHSIAGSLIGDTESLASSPSRRNLNRDNKDSPTAHKLSRPPSYHRSPSTPPSKAPSTSSATGKIRSPSPKGSQWGRDDDSRSILSVRSERYRRHSISGSSIGDNESLTRSPSIPSSMAPTQSEKGRSCLPSPSPAGLRRHSGPPRVENSSVKDSEVNTAKKVSNGGST